MNAYKELLKYLGRGEVVEAVVFGNWCAGSIHPEPEDPLVPPEKRGVVMTLEEAKPYMEGWCFDDYKGISAYEVYIWTNKRVIFVCVDEETGSTWLDSVPRNPVDVLPKARCG